MPEYDGTYEIEIVYSVTISGRTLTHRHSFDVMLAFEPAVGSLFSNIDIVEKSGIDSPLDIFMQDYMDVWSPLLGATTVLEEIILWKYDPEPSEAKIYISSMSPLPTTSFLGTSIAAASTIFTFRVAGYRYPMRMYINEGINSGEARISSGSLSGANLAYANYVVGLTSGIVGRSDGRPVVAIAQNNGQNEVLRRKRFRTE